MLKSLYIERVSLFAFTEIEFERSLHKLNRCLSHLLALFTTVCLFTLHLCLSLIWEGLNQLLLGGGQSSLLFETLEAFTSSLHTLFLLFDVFESLVTLLEEGVLLITSLSFLLYELGYLIQLLFRLTTMSGETLLQTLRLWKAIDVDALFRDHFINQMMEQIINQ